MYFEVQAPNFEFAIHVSDEQHPSSVANIWQAKHDKSGLS